MPKKKTNAGRAIATAKNTNLVELPDRVAIGDHEVRPEQLCKACGT